MESLNHQKSDKAILTEGRAQNLSVKNAKLRFVEYYTRKFDAKPSGVDVDYFIEYLRKTFSFLRNNKSESKYFEGLARYCIDGTFSTKGKPLEMDDTRKINDIKRFVSYFVEQKGNDNDVNVNFALKVKNGKDIHTEELSFDELYSMYDEKVPKYIEGKNVSDNINPNYEIVNIPDYDEASNFCGYTSWCVCHSDEHWDDNTHNGINTVYFCLRRDYDNYEGEPSEAGDDAPLDDYGLSMICVIVNPDGSLYKCTSRWNHSHGGDDYVMNESEISELMGCDFKEIFKPDNVSQKVQRFIDEYFEQMYERENSYSDDDDDDEYDYENEFFDEDLPISEESFTRTNIPGLSIIEYGDSYSLFNEKTGKLASDKWYSNIGEFNDGIAPVTISDGNWNYIDTNGDIVYPGMSFNYATPRKDGESFLIKRDGTLFILGSDSKLTDMKQRFEEKLRETRNFYSVFQNIADPKTFQMDNGLVLGCRKLYGHHNVWNVVDGKNIRILFDTWFTKLGELNKDYVLVKSNHKWSVLSKTGELLYPEFNVRTANNFGKIIAVRTEQNPETFELYNKNGRINTDFEIDKLTIMGNEESFFKLVSTDGLSYVMNVDGDIIGNRGFDGVSGYFDRELCAVLYDNKYNFMRTDGTMLSEDGYLSIKKFNKLGLSEVQTIHGNIEIINTNGEEVDIDKHVSGLNSEKGDYSEHFDFIDKAGGGNCCLIDGLYRVCIDDKYNVFDAENKRLLYKDWFTKFEKFQNGFAKVKNQKNVNYIKVNGEFLLPEENGLLDCYSFDSDGIAGVKTEQGYNYITSNGEFLCPDMFFTDLYGFNNGIAIVGVEDGYNLLNKSGELLYDTSFKYIRYYKTYEFYTVGYKDGGCNLLNNFGKTLSPVRFKTMYGFGFVQRVELFDGREFNFDTRTCLFYDTNDTYNDNPVDINKPSQEEQKIELTESMLRNIITEVIKDVYRI